jgi:hypothetical protein
MAQEPLRYDRMVESALRGVVREALTQVKERGLPGDHHFYVTFRTTHAGVTLADHLRARYPAEMTIVLQFQFYDLTVDADGFGVTLSFNNTHERLVIPFAAITTFADPSVNFALQFQPLAHASDADEEEAAPKPPSRPVLKAVKPGDELATQAAGRQKPPAPPRVDKADTAVVDATDKVADKPAEKGNDKADDAPAAAEEPRGQVVALDAFRKK